MDAISPFSPRLLACKRRGLLFCHATPILKSLHWPKSKNAMNTNVFLSQYKALTTAEPTYLHSLISVQSCRDTRPSSVVTLYRPTTTPSHKSLISLCIISSINQSSCLIPSALHKSLCWWCHSLIYVLTAHHYQPPSHIHGFIPGSKLTISTNLFKHSLT